MTALSIIIDILLILTSIVLIVTVLMQEGQRQGLGAIGGGAETFFGKNKAKSMEGRLQKYTKIAAAVFIVLAIVATIITAHNSDTPPVSIDDAIVEDAADAAEQAETAAEEAADTAEEKAEETAEAVEEKAEEAAEAVEEKAEEAAEAVENAAEAAEEKVEEAAENAGEAVEQAAKAADEATEEAAKAE